MATNVALPPPQPQTTTTNNSHQGERDIAESDPQETDTFHSITSTATAIATATTHGAPPTLIDHDTKHRIARAFRQLATHFETITKGTDDHHHHNPKDLSKRVSTLILKEDFIEAHQLLIQIIDSSKNDAYEKQHSELLSEILLLLTNAKGAAALHTVLLRDPKMAAQTTVTSKF